MGDKNKYYFRKYILGCIGLLLLTSCAQVVSPGGGKKDTTPPVAIKYVPDSATVNFKARSIIIFFDEFVQLKDLNSQLIISPPLEKAPDIKIKNKSVVIDLDKDEVLKPNTTYCINFGNALQDLNEGNPKEDFSYIFSTGSYIDSLTLRGKVQSAFDHKTEKGTLVMLYSDFSDSVVYKKQPDYFAKTKEDGSFQINNLHPGKYKFFALKDANLNYKYDAENETIGFSDTLVELTPTQNLLIETFQEPAKKLFLKKYVHNSLGKILFVFNKSADSVQVKPIGYTFAENDLRLEYSVNKDSLTYWFRNVEKDSLTLEVSNGSKILDTVEFKLIKKEEALKNKRNPVRLRLLTSPKGNQNFDLNSQFVLKFNHLIDLTKNVPISLIEDSTNLLKKFNGLSFQVDNECVTLINWDSTITMEDPNNPGTIISAPTKSNFSNWKENTNYHLFIPPGTFTDFFGLTNDSINIDFKTRELIYYGTVKLNITVPETKSSYIVQLLDEKENIIREDFIAHSEILNYTHLYPGKYKLKLIYDTNENRKWDSGNYSKKTQPEKVIYNSELITIRSNWDAELEWKVKN